MGDSELERLTAEGWEALAAGEWDRARIRFERARELGESGDVLDGLSRALHFGGEYENAIELTERAFAAYRSEGRPADAADRARWLAFLHGAGTGNMASAEGWMARAGELLEDVEECASHGWLSLDFAPFSGDPGEREQLASAALAIARRHGDVDLEYDALALIGESKVAAGDIAGGVRFLDQAMTALSSGEVTDAVAVSDICCRLLGACELAHDFRRAEQWMPIVEGVAWQSFAPPICRAHYGGILVQVGRWSEAEKLLEGAFDALKDSYLLMREGPQLRLAELRRRQGRFEEARRLIEGHESSQTARRTLALIAQAENEPELAEQLATLCLAEQADRPECAPVLSLLVGVRGELGDRDGALEALSQLEALADRTGSEPVAAHVELARGRLAAGGGSEGWDPLAHFQSAARAFAALELPFEAARAQLELADLLADEAPKAAIAEAQAALEAFNRIGADRDADAAAALLRRIGGQGRRPWPKGAQELTKRETEVLALLGEGCSNVAIAERLVISRRTAEHHVARILSKLDLSNRAEAAAYAARLGREDR